MKQTVKTKKNFNYLSKFVLLNVHVTDYEMKVLNNWRPLDGQRRYELPFLKECQRKYENQQNSAWSEMLAR